MSKDSLSKKQRRVIDILSDLNLSEGATGTACDVEEALGRACIVRKTLTRWLKDSAIKRAFYDRMLDHVVTHLPSVLAALIHKARNGDVATGKFLVELVSRSRPAEEAGEERDIVVRWEPSSSGAVPGEFESSSKGEYNS